AGDRHVVEKDARIGAAADAHPVIVDCEALTGSAATGANHQRGTGPLHYLVDVHGLHLARVVDRVGHRGRLVAALGTGTQVRPALLTVVGALGIDEAALGA